MHSHVLRNRLHFSGRGAELFGIYLVNLLLSILTLGLYYPWAKASMLRFKYGRTLFDGQPFQFHGTGKEMFIGMFKAIGIMIGLYLPLVIGSVIGSGLLKFLGVLVLLGGFLLLVPIAIHGSLRYRMSRTSWQGIHFGYRGDLKELAKQFLIDGLLTLVTFGIYSFWLQINLTRYTTNHIRLGNLNLRYRGDGTDWFLLNLKGYFLTIFTFGIYGFWWGRNQFAYHIDNLQIEHNGAVYDVQSSLTVGDFFSLVVVNLFILVFTLGLGAPWVITRTLETLFENILIDERLDTSGLRQTELEYRDATGEDMADLLDIGLV